MVLLLPEMIVFVVALFIYIIVNTCFVSEKKTFLCNMCDKKYSGPAQLYKHKKQTMRG